MKLKVVLAMGVCVIAAGCTKPASPSNEVKPKYDLSLDMKEMMGHVVDPGAWAFWKTTGTEETAKGTRSLTPTTEEGWDAAESGAAQVAEAGNLLQLPGYMRDADWAKFAQQLTAKALEAKGAIEAKDSAKMFKTGGELYEVCVACHAKYVMPAYIKQRDSGPKTPDLPDWPADVKARQQSFETKGGQPAK